MTPGELLIIFLMGQFSEIYDGITLNFEFSAIPECGMAYGAELSTRHFFFQFQFISQLKRFFFLRETRNQRDTDK